MITPERGADGVLHLLLGGSNPTEPFVLSRAELTSLDRHLDGIPSDPTITGLLIRSAHPTVFCAGADVDEMANLRSSAEAAPLVKMGQDVFAKLARLAIKSVALVHGTCVGGGFELALACSSRIASDDRSTKLGLPEVKLGILPAWGGSVRLTKLVGASQAVGMITAGRLLGGESARRMGIVASVLPKELMVKEALSLLARLRKGECPLKVKRPLVQRLLDGTSVGRNQIRKKAKAAIEKETRGHYPAPLAALEVSLVSAGRSLEEGQALERESVLRLLETPVHKELLRLFQITRESQRPPVYGMGKSAPRMREVAVIGGGIMGAGIAALALGKGFGVRLIDKDPAALIKARALAESEIQRLAQKREISKAEAKTRLLRLSMATDFSGLLGIELAIEAVPEKRELKERVLKGLSEALRPDALLATNTSSFPIAELACSVRRPERFLGLHFFNPPGKMPLLEIIRGTATSENALARGIRFGSDLGKTVIVVGDGPGFLVNRLLAPYFQAALQWVTEGADPLAIDQAISAYGLPMGPFRLMDEIGLDVVLDASRHMAERPGSGFQVHPVLEKLVSGKHLGKKSGSGFLQHQDSASRTLAPEFASLLPGARLTPDQKVVTDRLLAIMVKEARAIQAEGLVLSASDIDIGTVFGLGFPAFRGGLLRAAEVEGLG